MTAALPATTTLAISGMTCATCAGRVERALTVSPGVRDAKVNFALEQARVSFDPDLTTPGQLAAAVADAGYDARPAAAPSPPQRDWTGWMVLAGVLFTAPLLWPMLSALFGAPFSLNPWYALTLAAVVQLVLGARFYRHGFAALRHGAANMDVLVALGTSAAFFYSAMIVLRDGSAAQNLSFEASAVVLTLVLGGRWLEGRAKGATSGAIRALLALRPATAIVLRGGTEHELPISAVKPGDDVLVRPGGRIPVDGAIIAGESELDESAVTGESFPVLRRAGDRVVCSALNGNGALTIRTIAVGADTTLAAITRLVEAAQSGKAPLQNLVDRVSAVFVPVVVTLSVLTFFGWRVIGADSAAALGAAVAVLVVACPCALGLAMPAAIVAGIGAAARAGILFKDIDALERARQITTVVFDKTGTLTQGALQIIAFHTTAAEADAVLAHVAAVQSGSEHPLGRAIRTEARRRSLDIPAARDFRATPGQGVSATIDGQRWIVGNAAMMQAQGISIATLQTQFAAAIAGVTHAYIACESHPVGVISFADPLRETAAAGIAALKASGLSCMMLSGDSPAVAKRIGAELAFDRSQGGLTPSGKAEVIETLRHAGNVVAMVGDGINDAPALATADVGIAVGSGTDVAIETANITLMRPDPRLVAAALDIARRTGRIIRENLFWAFIYNLMALPLAATGLLSPMLAGAAMAASSLSVVLNALRLTRWQPLLKDVSP